MKRYYFLILMCIVSCSNEPIDKKPKIDKSWFNVNFINKKEVDKRYLWRSGENMYTYYEEIKSPERLDKYMYTEENKFTIFDTSFKHIEILFRKPIYMKPVPESFVFYNALICIDRKLSFYIIWFNYKKFELKENWEIGKHTDSVFTNINYSDFKKLYPEFSGKFNFNIVKRIEASNRYQVYQREFYHSIRFVGFDERYYNMFPDSGEKFVIPDYSR